MLCCFLSLGVVSCTKFVDGLRPADRLTTNEVFSDANTAEAAVVGIYTQQMTNYLTFYNLIGLIGGLSADDLNGNGGGFSGWFEPFNRNAIAIDFDYNNSLWREAYKTIYQCNAVVQNLEASTSMTVDVKSRLEGEAKFLRALTFFYLVNLYGDIPLPISTNYTENAQLVRAPANAVYEQILEDLDEATTTLDDQYTTTERIRANKMAAEAFRSRVYLYLGDWQRAIEAADAVISSPQYALSPPETAFHKESTEIILGISPASSQTFGTGDAYLFLPWSTTAIPDFSLSPTLFDAFEEGDLRKTNWVGENTVSGTSYFYPLKYKEKTAAVGEKNEYNIILRLAEVYLIKAEALAQQNDINGAIEALDKVRQRAGLPLLAETDSSIDQQDLLSKIYHEKQVEFFAEWGHRWLDLKRWGLADQQLSPIKSAWKSTAIFFPIPWQEIEVSPFLTQNDGYPSSL